MGCPEVEVGAVFSGGLTVGLFEGPCGAGGAFGAPLVRRPPPSHFPAQEVTSETTPGLFFPPLLFFDGLHFFGFARLHWKVEKTLSFSNHGGGQ